jgi:hypothetical protein
VAGYAGARPRTGLLGRRSPAPSRPAAGTGDPRATALPRRRVRGGAATRARGRSGRTGLIVAAIVVTFGLGLVSLAQTVRVSANGLEVERLRAERQILVAEQQEIRSDLYRLGSEPAVRKQALDAGLGQLLEPLVLPAR